MNSTVMNTIYPYHREMPVSARFYHRLILRIAEILASLDKTEEKLLDDIMYLVNVHLGRKHFLKSFRNPGITGRIIFETLKYEIDAAIERSRRTRLSASRRRALRESLTVAPDSGSTETAGNSDSASSSPSCPEKTASSQTFLRNQSGFYSNAPDYTKSRPKSRYKPSESTYPHHPDEIPIQ